MKLKIFVVSLLIILKLVLFIYPAVIISLVILDPQLKNTGQSKLVPMWFKATTSKYNNWAEDYLQTKYATTVKSSDVPATEWPMFGSVFFLLTAEELHSQNKINVSHKDIQTAINHAAQIISSPDTATWVKKKWQRSYLETGKNYLEKENVFYRMLLIMGLTSYEKITSNTQYHALLAEQVTSLSYELTHAPNHLADDYPGQCYPNDVLWAVAAIKKANSLGIVESDINTLTINLLRTLNTATSNDIKLPAFQMDSKTAKVIQNARGCGTSGILQFAPMLDINISKQWYQTYEKNFWKETLWLVGFREHPIGTPSFMDVDSGVIIDDIGSVATLFGIGASKSLGRFDHTVPLTIETITYAWPTPFGFLLPSLIGQASVDSFTLGDVALLFSMTRPTYTKDIISFQGMLPLGVWLVLFTFISLGFLLIWIEIRWLKWLIFQYNYKRRN